MALQIIPLHPGFGVEIRGLDLAGSVSDTDWAAITAAFQSKGVVVIRGSRIDEAGHT